MQAGAYLLLIVTDKVTILALNSYALVIGIPSSTADYLLSIMGATNVFIRVAAGRCDKDPFHCPVKDDKDSFNV